MYSFTESNKLKEKLRYEYFKYKGIDFIKSYFNNRINAKLKLLKTSKNKILDISQILTEPTMEKISLDLLNTNIFLKNSLFNQMRQPHNFNIKLFNIILRKFEVTKRIYESYKLPLLIKCGDNYSNVSNYCYFSINCFQYYKYSKNLKYLNSGIKSNDILVSILDEIGTKHEASITITCLEAELECVKNLCKKNGIIIDE